MLLQTQSGTYCRQERESTPGTAPANPRPRVTTPCPPPGFVAELDAGFFRLRLDRLTPAEKKYLRAMAELQPRARRSGDIAHILKKEVQSVALTRATLIGNGMIYSPSHGHNSFTVPLFDG